jgi:hypothetical protein
LDSIFFIERLDGLPRRERQIAKEHKRGQPDADISPITQRTFKPSIPIFDQIDLALHRYSLLFFSYSPMA